MKKGQADGAIRSLCSKWAREKELVVSPENHQSFSDFKSWLTENGYAHYLNFRSVAGAEYEAEMWFDQEMKQTWRR